MTLTYENVCPLLALSPPPPPLAFSTPPPAFASNSGLSLFPRNRFPITFFRSKSFAKSGPLKSRERARLLLGTWQNNKPGVRSRSRCGLEDAAPLTTAVLRRLAPALGSPEGSLPREGREIRGLYQVLVRGPGGGRREKAFVY